MKTRWYDEGVYGPKASISDIYYVFIYNSIY